MICKEQRAEIVRLYHAEKWRIGTISEQLGIHHSTVRRILQQQGQVVPERQRRASKADPFVPLIMETLAKYPRLPATRLWRMAKERGYPGGPDHFATVVARYRPRPKAEAYLRLRTLPGEQGQVDWAHFGEMLIGRAKRKLMAFVMVLSFCRKIFLRFFLGARMPSFLEGHASAFEYFGGVPRVLLYDNLKSAVLERQGNAIRFHPTLLELSAHYRYEARPVAVARGNEKGRVERAIRYIRTSFFAGLEYRDLDDLNERARHWCDTVASERQCPEDVRLSVAQAYEQEKAGLLELPADRFPCEERVEVPIHKTPYLRFDLNDYSVPAEHVRRTLTVIASLERVRIEDEGKVIAEHPRSWDREQCVENPAHIADLESFKAQARQHRGAHRLSHAAPASAKLIEAVAEQGGSHLGGVITALLKQLDLWGARELDDAISEALSRGTPHLAAVRHILERRHYERRLPPRIGGHLPRDERVQGPVVRPHALSDYDQLGRDDDEEDEPL